MATRIDTKHLRAQWLPDVNALLATVRLREHRVYVCAVILSQEEAEIGHLMETRPSFAVTQEKLDWQPDDDLDDLNEGDVYQHLLRMSDSEDRRLRRTPDCYLLGNVTSAGLALDGDSEPCSSPSSKSFRWSGLEIFNDLDPAKWGYCIGDTDFRKLAALGDSTTSLGKWYWIWYDILIKGILKLVWAQEGLKTAVLLHVQVDIVDLSTLAIPLSRRRPRKRYGPFLQVHGEESLPESRENSATPEAKQFKCVRWRPDRKTWVAEMRLPNQVRKNKVWFGDFKCQDQAARAVDAVYYYYGKQELVQFGDTPQVLPELPAGLEEEAKLEFVKSKAKWLAHFDPTLLDSVNAQEIPGGHTAFSDLLCPSPTPAPTPPTSLVPNTLPSTSDVRGSVEMPPEMFLAPEMFLEQSFSNNLEPAAEHVELDMQTILLDQFSCRMGSGVDDPQDDLVYNDSTAPNWLHMEAFPGFDDGDVNTRLLDSQSLQDLLFPGW